MSLTITNNTHPLQQQGLSNNTSPVNPADAKSRVLDTLDNIQGTVSDKVTATIDNRVEQWQQVGQTAEDNGYANLAKFANHRAEVLNAGEQRISDRLDRRFETLDRLVENRPEGGYQITGEQAQSLTTRIEANTANRVAALDARSDIVSERMDKLESLAMENGYDGSKVAEQSDRITAHLEQAAAHKQAHTDRMIERIQARLDETYGNPPEPDPASSPDDGLAVA